MTAGDVKGDEAVIIELDADQTVAAGDPVHIASGGKWRPTTDADDEGRYAVAIEASSGGIFRGVIWGRVETTCATVIPAGAWVKPGAAGLVVAQAYADASRNIGTAMDASTAGSGTNGTITIWVGM